MRRRIPRAQQTKNWCVGFSFPPPAYAGIHPTLYLFGFRANALNSHSSPYLPGFDPGSGFERFEGLRAIRGPLGACGASEACLLWVSRLFGAPALPLADPEISAFPGHLGRPGQWPPKRPSRRPRRPRLLGLGLLIT